MLSVGTLLDNRYEILSLLGSGGMATVYKARERKLERTVALKIMHDVFTSDSISVERFKRESQIVASMRHPNILTCFRMGVADGCYYSCLEYVDARTLGSVLEEQHQLEWRRAVELIIQVCDAVAHAHSAGIVHRDITPNNILIVTNNNEELVKVVDFGLAKNLYPIDDQQLTRTGATVGTLYYISPEQCRGQSVDGRADVYSIGCVLYQCLTGKPPFLALEEQLLMIKHATEQPDLKRLKLSTDAQQLQRIVAKCLEKSPEKRYPTADELRADLASLLQGTHPVHLWRGHEYEKLVIALSVLICVVVIALSVTMAFKPWLVSFLANHLDERAAASLYQLMERTHDTTSQNLIVRELALKYRSTGRDDLIACRIYLQFAKSDPSETAMYLQESLLCLYKAQSRSQLDQEQKQAFKDSLELVSDALRRSIVTNDACMRPAFILANGSDKIPADLKILCADYAMRAAAATRPHDLADCAYEAFSVYTANRALERATKTLRFAQRELAGLKQDDSSKLHWLLIVGRMNAEAGNAPESRRLLNEAVALWSQGDRTRDAVKDIVHVLQELANRATAENDFARANDYLRTAIDIEQKDGSEPVPMSVLTFAVAHNLSALGKNSEANSLFNKLLQETPKEPPRLKVLADLCINLRLAHEDEQVRKLCSKELVSTDALLSFETYILECGRQPERRARAACQWILDQSQATAPLFANHINALICLAGVDRDGRQYASAARHLSRALELLEHPNAMSPIEKNRKLAEVMNELVVDEARTNNLERAMSLLNKLESLPETRSDSCCFMKTELSRSRILLNQGRLEECDALLTQLYSSSTCSSRQEILLPLAQTKFARNRPKEAKALYLEWREKARFDPNARRLINDLDQLAKDL